MKKTVFCLCVLMSGSVGNAVAACSGYGCDGKDPLAEGCGNDAVTVAVCYPKNFNNTSSNVGSVELRWSNKCKTNWTRTTGNRYSSPGVKATVVRSKDGKKYTISSNSSTTWSRMVYGYNMLAKAKGEINIVNFDGWLSSTCETGWK